MTNLKSQQNSVKIHCRPQTGDNRQQTVDSRQETAHGQGYTVYTVKKVKIKKRRKKV